MPRLQENVVINHVKIVENDGNFQYPKWALTMAQMPTAIPLPLHRLLLFRVFLPRQVLLSFWTLRPTQIAKGPNHMRLRPLPKGNNNRQ
jgi:hypothetical protein